MKTRDKIDLGFLIVEAVMLVVNLFKKGDKDDKQSNNP
jgi:hypothetical protein